MVHSYNGTLFSYKKDQTTETWNGLVRHAQHGQISKAYAKWKKSGTKVRHTIILCDSIYETFRKRQNCRDRNQINGYGGGGDGVGGGGLTAKGHKGGFEVDRNVLCLDCGDYTTVYIHQNSLIYILRWVNFIVCKLYLIKLKKKKGSAMRRASAMKWHSWGG